MIHAVQKAFKIRAYLTPEQRRAFAQAEGATRYVRRRVLSEMDSHYKASGQRKTLLEMSREVTLWKQQEETAWLKDIPSDVISQELRDLKQAFEHFYSAFKTKSPSRKVGYPKPKRKSASGAIRFAFDHRHPGKVAGWTGRKVILPKLGRIKLAQPERLPEEMPKLVTLSRDSSGRFFISFSVKQTMETLPETGIAIGVDLGLIDLAVLSDEDRMPALKGLKKKERYLRRQQRILSRRQGSRKGEKKSRRYLRQLKKVNRMHCRIADARRDYAQKTSKIIIDKADVIALEDLNVKGMMKNPRLSKALSDAAFRLLRSCLEHKGIWYGRTVCYADCFAPTSKTCSHCGHQVKEMPLSVREWTCPQCGAHHDRDINAARNILAFAVTPGRGEGAYPDARGGVHPLREGALALSPKDSDEARTDFPDSGKVMRARIKTIQDSHDKAGFQNDLMAANDLAIKQTMIGQLWSKDDQDWFRIKNHPVGGKLPVYLNCSFINLSVNNPFVLSFYNATNQVQTLHRVYRADCVNRSYKRPFHFPMIRITTSSFLQVATSSTTTTPCV